MAFLKRNRGYLTFSVQDRFSFHRMNTKSSIFTSGEATSEILLLVFMSEIKIDLTLKKKNKFSVSFML